MGSGNSKTTDSDSNAQEDNEKQMKEERDEMEEQRLQALRDAETNAKLEDEEERRKLDRQKCEREEKERKQKEQERFLKLKSELMNYDFHKCPRIKKESFRDLEVDDIDLVRIALIGPTGSGKSTFVGTLQRAIGEPQSAFEKGTGEEGGIILEEYYVQKKIRMVDTRGFFARDEKLYDECYNIMTGRIRLGEEIIRNYDGCGDEEQEPVAVARKPTEFSKYVHAVMIVLKANDPRLDKDTYKEALQKIREYFKTNGYSPVTVITYLDMLKTEEDKSKAFDKASEAIGGPGERTHFITNYTHANDKPSFDVEQTALDILDSALLSAESFIRIRKQQEKNQLERAVMAEEAISGVETLAHFFARLTEKHHLTNQGTAKTVLAELRKKEINTVKALKELWEEVKADLPLSVGMEKILEQEIRGIN